MTFLLFEADRYVLPQRELEIAFGFLRQEERAADVRREQFDAWLNHLRTHYSARAAAKLLDDWSREDVYVPLEREVKLLERAGFDVEIIWRKGAFAVLSARR